jgi:transposase
LLPAAPRDRRTVAVHAAAAGQSPSQIRSARSRRLVKRRGKLKALVAIARSILVIVWHLLADPTARFHDLSASFYATRINKDRKTRSLVHQLEALGHKVILEPAAA